MEDLRFADFLVRHVTGGADGDEDIFLDGTGWEGGDEWLRAQFKWYLLTLLRSSQLEGRPNSISSLAPPTDLRHGSWYDLESTGVTLLLVLDHFVFV